VEKEFLGNSEVSDFPGPKYFSRIPKFFRWGCNRLAWYSDFPQMSPLQWERPSAFGIRPDRQPSLI
jgi:hypothetical protein